MRAKPERGEVDRVAGAESGNTKASDSTIWPGAIPGAGCHQTQVCGGAEDLLPLPRGSWATSIGHL